MALAVAVALRRVVLVELDYRCAAGQGRRGRRPRGGPNRRVADDAADDDGGNRGGCGAGEDVVGRRRVVRC